MRQVARSMVGTASKAHIVNGKSLPLNDGAARDPVARRARPTRSSAAVATIATTLSAGPRSATRRAARSRAAGRDSQRRAACANISGTSATPTKTCTLSSEYARGRSNDTTPIDHARPIPNTSMSATDEIAPTATPRPWPASAPTDRATRDPVLPSQSEYEPDAGNAVHDDERLGRRRRHDPRQQAGRDEKRYGDEEGEIGEPPRHTEMLFRRQCQRLAA